MQNKKVLSGMSGGVDSSVATAILMKNGYEVAGATLRLYDGEDYENKKTKTCCSLTDVEDARSVCIRLGIRHHVFNFKERFEKLVINRFVEQYKQGLTPNPCIDCNRYIKFSEMLDRAELLEFDYIATGHYAIIEQDPATGRYLLKKPVDKAKDQTYVLYLLTQEQLSKTLMPLGTLTKPEVRELADEYGFSNAHKPDSQDICFVPDGEYAGFIERFTGAISPVGDYLDVSGTVLGKHKGLIRYTIGQRKGLGVSFGKPMFVVDKNAEQNQVILGEEPHLFKSKVLVGDLNFIPFDTLTSPLSVTAKLRYRAAEQPAMLYPLEDGTLIAEFKTPQRAVTPGQAAVFYDGDIVVGGGTILGAID